MKVKVYVSLMEGESSQEALPILVVNDELLATIVITYLSERLIERKQCNKLLERYTSLMPGIIQLATEEEARRRPFLERLKISWELLKP